jgi:flagellar hook protein FlgE
VQLPAATQNISMTANLDSAASNNTTFPATVSVYDSIGTSQNVTVTYTEVSPGTWTYSANIPAASFTGGVQPPPITGTLTFDQNGNLASVTPTGGAAETVGTATGDVSSIPLSFTGLADGAKTLNLNWNLLGSAGTPNISQVDAASAVSGTTADGNGAGTCTGFTIGSDGLVTATYTSGSQIVGQVALADVTNLQGLNIEANGEYQTTLASGTASVGASGTGGLGGIQDSALEDSNVSISSEFSDLIIAQQGFDANSKAVTTFDQVSQDTLNMIH